MTTDQNLLPCPLCSQKAEIVNVWGAGSYIRCTGCLIRTDTYHTITFTIDRWNTRASAAQSEPPADADNYVSPEVKALACAIYCLSPSDEMPVGLIKEMAAKACIDRLAAQGYRITRKTMSEGELREILTNDLMDTHAVNIAANLAKRYAGESE